MSVGAKGTPKPTMSWRIKNKRSHKTNSMEGDGRGKQDGWGGWGWMVDGWMDGYLWMDGGLFCYAFPMLGGQWFARWLPAKAAGPLLPTGLQKSREGGFLV